MVNEAVLDGKYLEQLFIEIPSEQGNQMKKVPNINNIDYGAFNLKYAVYWKHKDHDLIIKECETLNEAMIFYKKMINTIIIAYNARKENDYSLYGVIYLKDIENTLFSLDPIIST